MNGTIGNSHAFFLFRSHTHITGSTANPDNHGCCRNIKCLIRFQGLINLEEDTALAQMQSKPFRLFPHIGTAEFIESDDLRVIQSYRNQTFLIGTDPVSILKTHLIRHGFLSALGIRNLNNAFSAKKTHCTGHILAFGEIPDSQTDSEYKNDGKHNP